MPKPKDSATDSENPKQPKRQRLPKFRSAHCPVRQPETNKSWVMSVKRSEDKRLRADATQRMHESASATPEPSSSVQVGNTDDFGLQIDSQMVEDAPPQSDLVSRKRKRDKTTCVHVIFASIYYIYGNPMDSSQSKLTQWLTLRDSTLDELLRRDGQGPFITHESCTVCLKTSGPFRCRDCGHGCRLVCKDCLLLKHDGLELHRVKVSRIESFTFVPY